VPGLQKKNNFTEERRTAKDKAINNTGGKMCDSAGYAVGGVGVLKVTKSMIVVKWEKMTRMINKKKLKVGVLRRRKKYVEKTSVGPKG